MKAMLYADWCTFVRSIKTYIFVMAVIVLAPTIAGIASGDSIAETAQSIQLGSAITVPALLALLSVISVFTIDEAGDWASVRLMMPLTRRTVVEGRYAFVALVVLATEAIGVAFGLFAGLVLGLVCGMGTSLVSLPELMLAAFVGMCVTLVIIAVEMPVAFRSGVEKMRLVFLIPFVISAMVAVPPVRDALQAVGNAILAVYTTLGPALSLALLGAAAAGIYLVSMRVSVAFYEAREG